jgi:hypothetical protein
MKETSDKDAHAESTTFLLPIPGSDSEHITRKRQKQFQIVECKCKQMTQKQLRTMQHFPLCYIRAINSSRAQSDLECYSTDKFISHKQCVAMTGALQQSVILQDHIATINAH